MIAQVEVHFKSMGHPTIYEYLNESGDLAVISPKVARAFKSLILYAYRILEI